MDGLIAFTEARLGEEEAAARELLRTARDMRLELKEPALLGRRIPGWYSWPEVEAMCTEKLRDVEAKRALLAELKRQDRDPWSVDADYSAGLCAAAKILAAALGDHPGYEEAWRP